MPVSVKVVMIVTSEGLHMHKHRSFFHKKRKEKEKTFKNFSSSLFHYSPHGVGPLAFSGGNFGLVEPVSPQLFWDAPALASCLTIAIKGDGWERKTGMRRLVCELHAPMGQPHTPSPTLSGLQSREQLFANIL